MDQRHQDWQGMNWLRQDKRLAIYLRDGLACAWCGDAIENGAKLSLDHIKCVSKGGSNDESNLVTCCVRCNTSRGNRDAKTFAKVVGAYVARNVKADAIIKHVAKTSAKPLAAYRQQAKEIIAARGSVSKFLNSK